MNIEDHRGKEWMCMLVFFISLDAKLAQVRPRVVDSDGPKVYYLFYY